MNYTLKCLKCGREYSSTYPSQVCECGGLLEVVYEDNPAKHLKRHRSFWDYEPLLPKSSYSRYVLGSTRLVRSHESESLFLKLEIDNPTRSFKDRGSVVEIAKAFEYGYDEIVCASTGNMAYSVSYYAKIAGIRARIFISNNANADKLRDIRSTGDAKITQVKGDFNMALKVAEKYAKENGAFLAGDYCYRKEGQRTVAYEIMEQLPEATHIIVPVGNATLISGMLKALKEMKSAGIIKRYPKVVAVQSEECKPFASAFKSGRGLKYERPMTKADAIAVGMPTFGPQAMAALKEIGGEAVTVSDKDMLREQKKFYEEYGLIAELAGVASVAAFRKLDIEEGAKAVAIVSGGNV
ncbi:MAG: threonine synthase [Candidatus Micrarchaeia archaeon]